MTNVKCLTCNKDVERQAGERDIFRRMTLIEVWCHGDYSVVEVSDTMVEQAFMTGHINLTAFARPVLIIIDRDRGDEDPNEPWQGETCQM